jgi:hypothetical protein
LGQFGLNGPPVFVKSVLESATICSISCGIALEQTLQQGRMKLPVGSAAPLQKTVGFLKL